MDEGKKYLPMRGNEFILALCEQYGLDPTPVRQITITAHSDSLVWVDIELYGDKRIAEIVLKEQGGQEPRDLFGKYHIEKADGTPVDPEAEYFVLRLDTDPAAREAIHAYQRVIRDENPELARDLLETYRRLEMKAEED